MDWYYANNRDRKGPVPQDAFTVLVDNGTITPDTLVWNANMTDWQQYADVFAGETMPDRPRGDAQTCTECGLRFDANQLIHVRDSRVCMACKPLFLQKLREGVSDGRMFQYAGFWIRLAAKMIDGVLLTIAGAVVSLVVGLISHLAGELDITTVAFFVNQLFGFAMGISYVTYFVGKYQATPGKMACGLIVIMPDGGRVSYARACGRYFGEVVSYMTCMIGFVIAGPDDEKRALHDRICATRVVKKDG